MVGRITLVGTVHRELGKCNEAQLLGLLKAVDPDVIFEEIRPEDHDRLYKDEAASTVEIRAIKSYMKMKAVRQVPVDDFATPQGLKAGADEIFAYAEQSSKEYCRAVSNIDRMAFNHGYNFLSGLAQIELRNKADALLETCISSSGNARLQGLLSAWYIQLRNREEAMLENIYGFCRMNSFSRGVYLVGAGHMSYIARGLEERLEAEPKPVEWCVWSG
ncbi:hypothetical protein [Isoalcanivorax indicus]|uniref:hypothetical protein n=1 Tax=Isoalcanivorax indicus TaxID=2202653 RepID=UPI0013C46A48|nr:hypothetical protein [Isoalcanivorax indicus]